MDRDLYSNLGVVAAVEAQTVTSSANGATVDLNGYSAVMIVANVGESGDTLSESVMIELELEESVNGSDWSDVADADLFNAVDGSNNGTFAVIQSGDDQAVYLTGYRGDARYIRPVVSLTGTHTNGTPVSVVAIRGYPHTAPVN